MDPQARRALVGWLVQHLRAMLERGEVESMTAKQALLTALGRALRSCGLRRMP